MPMTPMQLKGGSTNPVGGQVPPGNFGQPGYTPSPPLRNGLQPTPPIPFQDWFQRMGPPPGSPTTGPLFGPGPGGRQSPEFMQMQAQQLRGQQNNGNGFGQGGRFGEPRQYGSRPASAMYDGNLAALKTLAQGPPMQASQVPGQIGGMQTLPMQQDPNGGLNMQLNGMNQQTQGLASGQLQPQHSPLQGAAQPGGQSQAAPSLAQGIYRR